VSDGIAVELAGVDVRFGAQHVLRNLELRVPRGTNFVVMGRSGSGKSVTLKVISGLVRPSQGSVQVGDVRVDHARRADLARMRAKLGVVFQDAALINWMTAGENVALPLLERGEPADAVRELVGRRLAEVGLAEAAHKYPAELSGGMRKRVGFARATISSPELILYDEPTTGLDPQTTRTIDELVLRGRDDYGATGVIVSHDVASALRIADRIGILHEGRLEVVLTRDEFRNGGHALVRDFVEGLPGETAERN
jgi:phospholipid/cholesterol/gamma-HCH transport system ATP-binding protein